MSRPSLLICASFVLLTVSSVAQVGTQVSQKTTVEQSPDEKLIPYMGLNGRYTSTDAPTINAIRVELTKRANRGDAAAAFAIGRNCDYPTIDIYKQDRELAYQWYRYAASLGSPIAMYRVGQMYMYGEDGLPRDRVLGQHMITAATSRGFDSSLIGAPPRYGASRDASVSDASDSAGKAIVVGAAALALLFGGSSSDSSSGSSTDGAASYEATKGCWVPNTPRWVNDGNGTGHTEYTKRFVYPCPS